MSELDALLKEIEERAKEDLMRFVSDDIAANAEADVPRLVAALRYAVKSGDPSLEEPITRDDHEGWEGAIAAILRGEKP